jgi:hypothetical protein
MGADLQSFSNSNVAQAVRSAASHIEGQLYRGRAIRVGFSEKRMSDEFGPRLVVAYVIPKNELSGAHNYPLSIAGWALAEGRIIAWPDERLVGCDFDRLEKLGKLEELDRLVGDDRLVNAPPYLARAIDVARLKQDFAVRQLTFSAFYQDWDSWSPVSRYRQFISVPVPIISDVESEIAPEEYGVFNIDTLEAAPLLDDSAREALLDVSKLVASAYRARDGRRGSDFR